MSLMTKLLNIFGAKSASQPYWLKITTKVPKCVYYFGPFDSPWEAKSLQSGYIEDLMAEEAQGIHVELERGPQPDCLTIFDEEASC